MAATQKLVIVLWSCGPDQPSGAALAAAPFVYALAARALDVDVEMHFTGSTVRWLLEGVAAHAFTDAAGTRTVLDYIREARAAGVRLHPCAMALHQHRDVSGLIPEAGTIAGAATVVGASFEPAVRTLVF